LIHYELCIYFVHYPCQIYLDNEDRRKFIESKSRQMCTNAYDIKYALPIIRRANVIILASRWQEWSV
jgi:hypothetical protein